VAVGASWPDFVSAGLIARRGYLVLSIYRPPEMSLSAASVGQGSGNVECGPEADSGDA